MQTANNDYFLRFWWEVSVKKCSFYAGSKKWISYSKGGEFRRWWGNNDHILLFDGDGGQLRTQKNATMPDLATYDLDRCTWSDLGGNSKFGVRKAPSQSFYDIKGHSFFPEVEGTLSYSNSNAFSYFLSFVCSGMNFQVGDVGKAPAPDIGAVQLASGLERRLVALAKSDWDAYETSWDFTSLPILSPDHLQSKLEDSYASLRVHWQGMTDEMQRLEEENNRIFIDAYGLQNELMPEVPSAEITLTCNPAYSLKTEKSDEQRKASLLARTAEEFLHYAVGCMFGRYSLDAPGLILANQGEGLAEYLARVPQPTFEPDADNVIPVLDGDWFADDIAERFRKFLRVTFGEAKFQENLAFIEGALGKDIRKWFTRDFYDYHVRRYKKRPIYWMFASPKGSFQALIYMHRYRPDTVSVVLNDYLREYRNKLEAHRKAQEAQSINPEATPAQRTKALKEVGEATKVIEELDGYERDVLYPLATKKIEIDLDDGVKANYPKFGAALKPIKGLSDADD
jgi:hypothetical protein